MGNTSKSDEVARLIQKTYAKGQIHGLVIGTTQAAMNLLMGTMEGLAAAGCHDGMVAKAVLNWQAAIEHLKRAVLPVEEQLMAEIMCGDEGGTDGPPPTTLKFHPGAGTSGPIDAGQTDLN